MLIRKFGAWLAALLLDGLKCHKCGKRLVYNPEGWYECPESNGNDEYNGLTLI
jgi:hypothetical protein